MAQGLERIPLAVGSDNSELQEIPLFVGSDFHLQPVQAKFPDQKKEERYTLIRLVDDPDQPPVAAAPEKRSMGDAVSDTGVQLAEGVNTILGAVPNLVAPEGDTAGFFNENAQYWRDQQSDVLKSKIAKADQAITTAGEDGVVSQITEAASQYFSDPALAARFVATNLPSMIPGIGAAKVVQAAALAKGAAAARAAQIATTAAGATNAALNAGGARGEAFADIKRTLIEQGMPPDQAEQKALEDSRIVAAVGGIAGYISGKTGLERSLVGQGVTKGAVRSGAASTVAELAGEQLEEVAPKLTTNVQAGQYDGRSFGQDVGRTIVETAIGSGPGAVVSGVASATNKTPETSTGQQTNNPKNAPGTGVIQSPVNQPSADPMAALPELPIEGEVVSQDTLPSGQSRLMQPAIEGEYTTMAGDLPRLALPAPADGGPTVREVAAARGLLNHHSRPSPELLMRALGYDADMAARLYAHWQENDGKRTSSNGGQSNGTNAPRTTDAEMDTQGAEQGRSELPGSGSILAFEPTGNDRRASDSAEVVAPSVRAAVPDGAAGAAGLNNQRQEQQSPDELPTALDAMAHGAATSPFNAHPQPSDGQKKAGNYRKGHVSIQGMDISIENPAGSVRSGSDEDGKPWQNELKNHYGYIKGTVGRDKDHLDVFLGTKAEEGETAYVVDQINPNTGKFDEHKIVIGASSEQEASDIYHDNYQPGWKGFGAITAMPMSDFKAWIKDGDTKNPLSLGRSVKQEAIRAYPKTQADALAARMTKQGLPSEAYPHPAGDGTFAIRPATGQATETIAGTPVADIQEASLQRLAKSKQPAAEKAKREIERRAAASDSTLDIAYKDDMKESGPEGQHLTEQAANSPHPVAAEATHAEADSPNVQPVESSVSPVKEENKPADTGASAESRSNRTAGTETGGTVRDIQAVVEKFKSMFKGVSALNIRVVHTVEDIPLQFRPSPYAEGVYHDDAGLIYMVADNLLMKGGRGDEVRAFQVLMHECVGHFGLAAMMGKRFDGLLKHVMSVARNANVTEDIYDLGDKEYATVEAVRLRYPEASDKDIAQEVMARMAESKDPSQKFGYVRAVIRQWFRDMARAMGFDIAVTTDELNDLIAKASQYLRRGKNLETETEPTGLVAASKKNESDADLSFVNDFLTELSYEDAAFRHPISKSLTLEGNIKSAYPEAEYLGEDTRPDEREESQADRRFVFAYPDGRFFYVFERGNEVWIDVSRSMPGYRTSAIYHGVANYAYNTGMVFVGDPNGLTEDSVIRRTSAMLSSALRFGTTSHFEAAKEQIKGFPEKGIEPLNWKGDDVAKTKALIHTFITTLQNQHPDIKDDRYDFRTGRFLGPDDRPVEWEDLRVSNAAARSPGARAARAGEASLRRGILIQSLASSESGERPGLLELVLNRSTSLVQDKNGLKAVFSLKRGLESRRHVAGDSGRQYSPDQLKTFSKIGREVETPTIKERIASLWQGIGKKLQQGIADQFAPLKDLGGDAYLLSRMSKGADGALEAMMMYGRVFMRDGVYDVDVKDGGVIDKLLRPLGAELDDFVWWVAGNRSDILTKESEASRAEGEMLINRAHVLETQARQAESDAKQILQQAGNLPKGMLGNQRAQKANAQQADALLSEGKRLRKQAAEARAKGNELKAVSRENLMTKADIANLKSLGTGQLDFDYTLRNGQKTRDRAAAYAEANETLQAFNKSVMDIAEQSGLIDGAARSIWEREFYVPFYREMEGDKPKFPNVKSGLVRQKAFDKLKGGTEKLNHDLLANTLMNWSHILNAAAKNRAAKAALTAAESVGAAERASSSDSGTVSFKDGGSDVHYLVTDPLVLDAVTALEFSGFSGAAMQAMGAFKRWLTMGVTASPTFKIRNLIRDSISAVGQGELSYNLWKNFNQGRKATNKQSQTYASMLAGGGIIRFGTMIEGARSNHVRRLVESGVDPDTIIDSESKLKAIWKRNIMPVVDAYNELGDRSEGINRAALYEQLRAKGMSHAEASFAARDLLDFSMGGTFSAVRFLTQVVPFANARIQGLYKLGRAANENPKRMGYVVGAVVLASLALLTAYHDDDDWKKREDWDRDSYWWAKIPGTDIAIRIPKPFEIGAMGTLAERSAELLFDKEMDGQRFGKRLGKMVTDTFAMNPVPQMFKPLLDLYANTDSFTGRAIETMGMENRRKEDRFTARTSEAAKLIGQAGILSPVQIDHLIRGYFGWIGTASTTAVDQIVRLGDDVERPSMKLRDVFLIGSFVETLPTNSSRYVTQMYEQSKAIEEAYNSWRHYLKIGDIEQAKEVFETEKDKINHYRQFQAVKRAESSINAAAQRIEQDKKKSGDQKRDELDRLSVQKDKAARSLGAAGLK